MSQTPEISIIIPVWKDPSILEKCFHYLSTQTLRGFEIVLVDNGVQGNVMDEVSVRWPDLNIIVHRLTENKGYAIANNIGSQISCRRWLVLLNDDAFPQPDWLEHLIFAAEKNPEYSVFTSRQIQYNFPDLLDGAGDSYHITGLAWRRYYNKSVDKYGLRPEEVFSACPAAALYSREEFLKIGGFDEDYFSYFEDVDLGFRLRLNGARCLYVPDAVVHHVGSASTGKRSDFSVYYGYRNMIWTFFKDMPSPYFWLFLPLHFLTVLFFAFYLTLRGQGKAIWKAIWDALRGLPKILEKRKTIQKNMKIAPRELIKVMSVGLLEPYAEFISRNRNK